MNRRFFLYDNYSALKREKGGSVEQTLREWSQLNSAINQSRFDGEFNPPFRAQYSEFFRKLDETPDKIEIKPYYRLWANGNLISGAISMHERNTEHLGKWQKDEKFRFRLKFKHYRKIASASSYLYQNKKYSIKFMTLTIGTNVKDNDITNKAVRSYLNLLRTRYGLEGYLWTVERQKRGAIHYHMLIDMPYLDYVKMSELWSNVLRRFDLYASPLNSVDVDKVRSVKQSVRYITKYITKQISNRKNYDDKLYGYKSRSYSIAHKINKPPVQLFFDDFWRLVRSDYVIKHIAREYNSLFILDVEKIVDIFYAYVNDDLVKDIGYFEAYFT